MCIQIYKICMKENGRKISQATKWKPSEIAWFFRQRRTEKMPSNDGHAILHNALDHWNHSAIYEKKETGIYLRIIYISLCSIGLPAPYISCCHVSISILIRKVQFLSNRKKLIFIISFITLSPSVHDSWFDYIKVYSSEHKIIYSI